ncbi:hypothetical protein PRIPAC_92391 [Pristionchus pacificus]|uniref:Uncharacterized protein n=1 Tax=Pristionchus pacificus TaxID=54126 RepID=A0A2A6C969_PRIPA|nr:hypothetical protein PRIPAC_92391 [Pristionchus pacificus]|eukprot:PDM74765.1 hypothetical protein PRIPAC_43716 [Pristionchus pacificus]
MPLPIWVYSPWNKQTSNEQALILPVVDQPSRDGLAWANPLSTLCENSPSTGIPFISDAYRLDSSSTSPACSPTTISSTCPPILSNSYPDPEEIPENTWAPPRPPTPA